MSGLPARAARQRAADVLYQVGLDEERYRLIKGFSTGMKQRVKLAQAIVHDPGLVFLDEPTNGMDPQGREEMLDLIVRIHRMLGIAVVVSSHILEDIERVCDYVVILDGGRLVLSQPHRRDLGDGRQRRPARPHRRRPARRSSPASPRLGIDAGAPERDDCSAARRSSSRFDGDHVYDAVRDVAADLGLPLRSLRNAGADSLEDVYIGNRPMRSERPTAQATR